MLAHLHQSLALALYFLELKLPAQKASLQQAGFFDRPAGPMGSYEHLVGAKPWENATVSGSGKATGLCPLSAGLLEAGIRQTWWLLSKLVRI